MKKFSFLLLFIPLIIDCYAQQSEQLSGAIQADSVQVTRSDKRKARREAAIRKKTRMLTKDFIEKGLLQFEPEVGFYHGNQINMNAGHYTKTGGNSLNEIGSVDGWHEDTSGGKYSGKPLLQIIDGRFYCNLEPMISSSRMEIIGTSAREVAMNSISKIGVVETESSTSEEALSNWRAFDTEFYKIQNIREVGDYQLAFDILVNQFNIINNTSYEKFTFQCILNILDGRMSLRIVAGENRACASYFGYMNVLRGGSF